VNINATLFLQAVVFAILVVHDEIRVAPDHQGIGRAGSENR